MTAFALIAECLPGKAEIAPRFGLPVGPNFGGVGQSRRWAYSVSRLMEKT